MFFFSVNGEQNTKEKKRERARARERWIKNVFFIFDDMLFYLDLVFSLIIAAKSRSDLHVACK